MNSVVRDIKRYDDPMWQTFLDAQLLIAAQTTADKANALYGAAALDLPRRGVNHVRGGIGALAKTLADWITAQGGEILYRQQVSKIELENGRATAVQTKKGLRLTFDNLLANLTPWALADLLGQAAPPKLQQEVSERPPTWGAFTLYLGVKSDQLPANLVGHHQVVVDPTQPLGEGNSVFISFSDADDPTRAPARPSSRHHLHPHRNRPMVQPAQPQPRRLRRGARGTPSASWPPPNEPSPACAARRS
jgi:phytoene dehydrogenase-like protein